MQNHWKALQNSFTLSDNQLKAALCRITHFQKGEVKGLRGKENDVAEWLKNRNIEPAKIYRKASQGKSGFSQRYQRRRRQDKCRLVLAIKQKLMVRFSEKSSEQVRKMVRRVSRYYYGEIKKITEDEKQISEILQKYNVRPPTMYAWLLQTIAPQDIAEELKESRITEHHAKRAIRNRVNQRRAALELTILEQGKSIVNEVLL